MKSLIKFEKKKKQNKNSRGTITRKALYAFLCKVKVRNVIKNKNNFLKMNKTRYLKKNEKKNKG